MRLPFLQVAQEEMARARTLAGYLGVPYAHALGMVVALKAAALEAAPDGDVSGDIRDHNPAEWVAVQCGWPLDRAESLAGALTRCGFVVARPSGGHAVAGMEPYARALDTSGKRADAGRRGAEARKARGGYGRAMAAPQHPDGHGIARDAKTQTQTQTQKEEDLSASRSAGAEASGEDLPDATEHARPAERPPLVLEPSPSDAPPEEPKRRPKPAKASTGDPRHAPLVDALCEAAPGYAFTGGRDAKAVSRLLELADALPATAGDAAAGEVVRRWRIARAWQGFPLCRHLGDLADNWNAYTAPQRPQRGRMDTTPSDFKRLPEGGIDLGEYTPGGIP